MQKIETRINNIEKKAQGEGDILKIEPLAKDFVIVSRYNAKRELQEQTQILKNDFTTPIKIKGVLQNKIIIDLSKTTQKNIDDFIDKHFTTDQLIRVTLVDDIPNKDTIIAYLKEATEEEKQEILDKVADTEYIPQSKINELAQ